MKEEETTNTCVTEKEKDLNELINITMPLFNQIEEYWDDIHLEFWQGIFEFRTQNKNYFERTKSNMLNQARWLAYIQHISLKDDVEERIEEYILQEIEKAKTINPKELINSPENGEKYCNTLVKIYPHINKFIQKYPDSQSDLMEKFDSLLI